jgi:hypothetical protein
MKNDPAASVRWFDAEQAMTLALQAYYAACRDLQPPEGESWDDAEAGPWASAGDFAWEFHAAFTRRLSLAAWRRGIAPPCGSADEPLGWPKCGDVGEEMEFLEHLGKCGLCVEESTPDNRPAKVSR